MRHKHTSKETHINAKRDPYTNVKKNSYMLQKKLIYTSKETHMYIFFLIVSACSSFACQIRHEHTSKETHIYGKRDPYTRQKRPTSILFGFDSVGACLLLSCLPNET